MLLDIRTEGRQYASFSFLYMVLNIPVLGKNIDRFEKDEVKLVVNVIEQLINGLRTGSIYALIALGYSMVYGIAKMINFAHGDIIMVGAYALYVFVVLFNMPIIVAVLLTIALCAILGITIERIAYKPLRKAPPLAVLITAIGVSFFLQKLESGKLGRKWQRGCVDDTITEGHSNKNDPMSRQAWVEWGD